MWHAQQVSNTQSRILDISNAQTHCNSTLSYDLRRIRYTISYVFNSILSSCKFCQHVQERKYIFRIFLQNIRMHFFATFHMVYAYLKEIKIIYNIYLVVNFFIFVYLNEIIQDYINIWNIYFIKYLIVFKQFICIVNNI